MTTYVRDTVRAAWAEGDVYLWHKATGISFTDDGSPPGTCRMAGVYITACGRKITTTAPDLLHEEMTLADWDARFGDDVDLCACAVSEADASGVAEVVRESSERA